MRRALKATIILAALVGSNVQLLGDDDKQTLESAEPDKLSPREALKRHFDRHSPPLGSVLPDVVALDADGNEFRLGQLKGHHSVMVFGCLT